MAPNSSSSSRSTIHNDDNLIVLVATIHGAESWIRVHHAEGIATIHGAESWILVHHADEGMLIFRKKGSCRVLPQPHDCEKT